MTIEFTRGQITFVQVRHDAWCRAQYTQRADDCICNPEAVAVDRTTWVAGVEQMNRKQRREAERKARRAKQ